MTSLLALFISACLLLPAGCAGTPPKVKPLLEQLPSSNGTPPEIVGARGRLSRKLSKKIIDRLKRQLPTTDMLERHLTIMQAVSLTPLLKGNKATLLVDGPDTYSAMFKAIDGANQHINLESFIIEEDETGNKLADLLLQKQAQGVEVNLIYDSVGSFNTSSSYFERLREGGVRILEFNPINPLKEPWKWRFSHRDHRKILVVDGKVAITGGVNISHVYSSRLSGRDAVETGEEPWRDTDVQIEGPAVAEFQRLFLDTWKREKGMTLVESNYYSPLREMGHDLVYVVANSPGDKNRTTFVTYLSAFICATKSIHLTNAYFVPDHQTLDALVEAAKRGVDVKIILPGASADVSLAFYAGRRSYARLLKAGIKLYERKSGMLHAKTAVIDGVWSTVGSTNLDLWSFANNDEVNAVILSPEFAQQLETLFSKDLAEATEITLDHWKHRPLLPRLKEWGAYLLYRGL